jgi:hypothetical protein
MTIATIEAALNKALLNSGGMKHELYLHELEELIDELITSMTRDNDHYIFAVTENNNDIAMVLIERSGKLYINEEARAKLQKLWPLTYEHNMKQLIPNFASQLFRNELPINGVKVV